jgi:hypothetical protein
MGSAIGLLIESMKLMVDWVETTYWLGSEHIIKAILWMDFKIFETCLH